VIRLERVTRRFADGREALQDVSLELAPDSFNFLTGHSGAGKSTLIRLLLGLDKPTRGRVFVDDLDIATLRGRKAALYRRTIGAVFQEHHLLAQRSIIENVMLPLKVGSDLRPREMIRRARAALGLVGLAGREEALPGQLSLGEQQRVGIARALVNRPRLLLADEPTGNLDPQLSSDVIGLFRRFHEIGTTVIIATHDLQLLEGFAARRIELQGGRLVSS
jgi:cell division transport system ATP-binding protein